MLRFICTYKTQEKTAAWKSFILLFATLTMTKMRIISTKIENNEQMHHANPALGVQSYAKQ
jgi:hypothetical protein